MTSGIPITLYVAGSMFIDAVAAGSVLLGQKSVSCHHFSSAHPRRPSDPSDRVSRPDSPRVRGGSRSAGLAETPPTMERRHRPRPIPSPAG